MIREDLNPNAENKPKSLPEKTRGLIVSQVLEEYQKRKDASIDLVGVDQESMLEIIKVIEEFGKRS